MIHYHGTPCGGPRQDVARFLAGRHALIPFPRPEDLAVAADVCQSFILDNGAFSIWKNGGNLDFQEYIAFCAQWARHPAFDWAIIPDRIDGSESQNDNLLQDWPKTIPGVPVWHFHESTERLVHLAHDWPTVALGSSGQWPHPGTQGWWDRMAEIMSAICNESGQPLCKLHGLRMLSPDIFTRIPLHSADSTNAVRNSNNHNRYGNYLPPTQAQRMAVIADRIEGEQSAPAWIRPSQKHLWELL
jgi:hypothetical protein